MIRVAVACSLFLLATLAAANESHTSGEIPISAEEMMETAEPQWLTCTNWSGWANFGPSFCSSSMFCVHCWPVTEGQFSDQLRRRTCSVGTMSWEEVESRTVRTGCCGGCIPISVDVGGETLCLPVGGMPWLPL
jgi:hypothetical protein